jgi:hypothetical protein
MTPNIHTLFDPTLTDNADIATVAEAENGQAILVNLGGERLPVAGHLSGVEALKIEDRVLIIRTGGGIIVAGRLRARDEAPSPRLETRDGHLVLEADRSVCLKAGDNRVEVHADGHIELNGRKITGQASGSVQLTGAAIKMN